MIARTSMRPMATRIVGAGGSGAGTRGSHGSLSWSPSSSRGRTILGKTTREASSDSGRSRAILDPSISPLAAGETPIFDEGTGANVVS